MERQSLAACEEASTEPWEELRVTARGLQFSVLSCGPATGTPVIALHGWMDNAASFFEVAKGLPECRLLLIELAGHGHSEHRPEGQSYVDVEYAADVIAIIDALAIPSFFLLGHSMGGGIATLVAGALPRRVRGLVVIEALGIFPSVEGDAPKLLGRWQSQLRILARRPRPTHRSVEQAVLSRMRGLTQVSESAARLLVARDLRETPAGWVSRCDARAMLTPIMRLTESQVACFLQAIKCPVKVVLASDGYTEVHDTILRRTTLIQDVEVVWMSGGHHLHLEQAAVALAAFTRSFIEQLNTPSPGGSS